MSKATPSKTTPKTTSAEPSFIGPNTVIKLKIASAEVKKVYQKVLAQLAKTTATAGFRKGKVPLEIAEGVIGQNKLIEKTFNEVVSHEYYHAIIDQKKQPLTNPEFNPISISMDKDWEVEAHFAERPEIKLGDYVKTAKAALKAADQELAEAAKSTEIKTTNDAENRETRLRHIFKALVEAVKPAIPELLLRQETRYELDDLIKNLTQLNLKLDDYVAKRQMTTQDLSNELAATALGKLQLEFILGAIANDQKLTAAEAELDKALAEVKDPDTRARLKADTQTMRQLEVALVRQKVVDYLVSL